MKPSSLYAAFLYGVNIPGGRWLTSEDVEKAFVPLGHSVAFAGIVGRPDSFLVLSRDLATEDSVRRAVTKALDCPSVVLSKATLEQVADAALDRLLASGDSCVPPYRVTSNGVEWEWCLVLSSDPLPLNAEGEKWLFRATTDAVAVAVLERRALLVRKRRFNDKGTRITLGKRLNAPWERTLAANGITVACLTSRTLNRTVEVAAAAKRIAL